MDPYALLGLQRTCTLKDIKTAYKRLAMQNHPDKLRDQDDEVRKACEDKFKQVTAAYHLLSDKHCEDNTKSESWKDMWETFFSKDHLWQTMVDVATKYIKTKRHKVTMPVTLEEIYNKKEKRAEFFLKGLKDPVRTTIDCAEYPDTMFEFDDGTDVHHVVFVRFVEQSHTLFDMEDGDLFMNMSISWNDYIQGCTKEIRFLDGHDVATDIPPFQDLEEPIVIKGKGMDANHDMHITLHLSAPSHTEWCKLCDADRQKFLQVLQKIAR